jgi:hypothetical protein
VAISVLKAWCLSFGLGVGRRTCPDAVRPAPEGRGLERSRRVAAIWSARSAPNLIAIIALLVCGMSRVRAQDLDFKVGRVRTTDQYIRDLLREGYRDSPTLCRLVKEIQQSDGIVYIEQGGCGASLSHGCLMHQVVASRSTRFLRIHVNVRDEPRLELIARLAHELQHAREVLDVPDVRSAKAMRLLFARIGLQLSSSPWGVETLAAVQAGVDVRQELRFRRLSKE